MLIPIRTDATVYYRGYATFAIIAANLLLFIFVDPEENLGLWILEFGTLKPWQWITSAFSHAGFLHVGMNMLFLFWFGQIVEGRIGSGRFLLVYAGIAAAEGLATQVLMLGADEGGALGASGVIYGLIVIALIIEREAKITCVILMLFIPIFKPFDIRLRSFAVFYLAWNLFWAMVFEFEMSSEVLHLIGAAAGLGAAALLRKWNWVYDPERTVAAKPTLEDLRACVRTVPAEESSGKYIEVEPPSPERQKPKPSGGDLPPLELD